MFDSASILTLLPFAMALACTHLLVLPVKFFFLEGDLRDQAQRATIADLIALAYFMVAFVALGGADPGSLWMWILLLPVLAVAAYSIGIWFKLLFRGPPRLLVLDTIVYTVIAFATA